MRPLLLLPVCEDWLVLEMFSDVDVYVRGLMVAERPASRFADSRIPQSLKPTSVIRVNQLVVSLPLTTVVFDNSMNDPAIARGLRGGLSQAAHEALNCRLSMTPDALRLSICHSITSLESVAL